MQLSERTTFDNLTFDQIFFNGSLLLSDTLIAEHNLALQPGEQITHKTQIPAESVFIAVVAAYRDIDHAKWKHVYSVKAHSHRTTHLKLDAYGITVTSRRFSDSHQKQKKASAEIATPLPPKSRMKNGATRTINTEQPKTERDKSPAESTEEKEGNTELRLL
jgi:hypothetical protein